MGSIVGRRFVNKFITIVALSSVGGISQAQDTNLQQEAALESMKACMVLAYEGDKTRSFEEVTGTCNTNIESFLAFFRADERESIWAQISAGDEVYRQENP